MPRAHSRQKFYRTPDENPAIFFEVARRLRRSDGLVPSGLIAASAPIEDVHAEAHIEGMEAAFVLHHVRSDDEWLTLPLCAQRCHHKGHEGFVSLCQPLPRRLRSKSNQGRIEFGSVFGA